MKKRTAAPWMSPAEYGRTLVGLTVNLIVRDVAGSTPFYTDVLELRRLYADAAFAGAGGVRLQLHADHTYERMPWAARLREAGKRGLGAEIRILGLDPDGRRDCVLEDPDGYTFAVGTPL